MKNCLVVDDDPLICDLIKHFCSKQPWIASCLSVMDGNQALQAVNAQKFDLIFLDYNLPDLSGKNLLSLFPGNVPVIMVTTEEAFGAESYSYDQIIDFLVKPVSYERFLKSLQRFQQLNDPVSVQNNVVEGVADKLIVKDGNRQVIIRIDDIRYIKSEANYVVFYLNDKKKVMSLMRMKQLEMDLPNFFARVHKSYIINMRHLESIDTEKLTVDGAQIPVGPKYRDDVKKNIAKWVG